MKSSNKRTSNSVVNIDRIFNLAKINTFFWAKNAFKCKLKLKHHSYEAQNVYICKIIYSTIIEL